ncbi:MAG: ABC transporter permease [Oscillospiraceae bacterium]|nr:ABC transporter permease [Oscillospiraceae bacterium]
MLIKFVIKRLILLIPVLLGITIMLFALSRAMPGDPARMMLNPDMRPELMEAALQSMRERLGLDQPIVVQYFRWLYNYFVLGDFGHSSLFNRPVNDVIGEPLRNTIILNATINVIYLIIALPIGIKMAVKRGSLFDNSWQVFSLAAFSVPAFFLGLSLIFIFSINLGWFPIGGMPNRALLQGTEYTLQWVRTLVLPATTLIIISLAGAIRYTRNAMIDALSQDYIRTARSKGLSEKVVIYSHAFRNALIPISTIIVGVVFSLFAGAAVTEMVFGYNGIGRMIVAAVQGRDRNLIISMQLFFSMVSVTAMLVADIVYGLIDPRIKLK